MSEDQWKEDIIRRVNEMESFNKNLADRIVELEKQAAVSAVQKQNTEKRIKQFEDMVKWIVRLIVGGIVSFALAYALSGGLASV